MLDIIDKIFANPMFPIIYAIFCFLLIAYSYLQYRKRHMGYKLTTIGIIILAITVPVQHYIFSFKFGLTYRIFLFCSFAFISIFSGVFLVYKGISAVNSKG